MFNMEELATLYKLEGGEKERLVQEFLPLVQEVAALPGRQPVRHLYCSDMIEELLLDKRRLAPALSGMCGRRVFLTAQGLVEELKRMRNLLASHKNFEVCFLSSDAFDDLSLHICVWGSSLAIGWVNGKNAAATRIYPGASSLYGYCDMVWSRIPSPLRSRPAAGKKIDQWLKKAQLYGLDV